MADQGVAENFISGATVLVVADIHRSVAFYRHQLGFEVRQIWGDPPSFAIADTPRVSIMLKQGVRTDDPNLAAPNKYRVGGLWDAYIWINDMDVLVAHLTATATPYTGPQSTNYECTEIEVTDPDGYIICFGHCP